MECTTLDLKLLSYYKQVFGGFSFDQLIVLVSDPQMMLLTPSLNFMLCIKWVNGHFPCTKVGGISVGAALGPLMAGLISPTGWNNVFYMLISADVLACLVRITTVI